MATTTINRSGTFDATKLYVLEGQLLVANLPVPVQVYGTATGLQCVWPNGLTAPQQTQATSIINAYVEPTDTQQLNNLQQQAVNFLNNPSPTQAQSVAALKQVIKLLLRLSTNKTNIDGTDLTT